MTTKLSDVFDDRGKVKAEPAAKSLAAQRRDAAKKAISKERELDMSAGYGGDYRPGDEVPKEAEPDIVVPGTPEWEGPTRTMPKERKPEPPGIYEAEGDDWVYEVQEERGIRAKPPGGDWITIDQREPEALAAIVGQIADKTLKRKLAF